MALRVSDVRRDGTRALQGVQLFASAQDEPRARRPTDIVLAITSALMLVVAAALSELVSGTEAAFSNVVDEISGLFSPLWKLCYWAPFVWSIVLLLASLARRRLILARDLIAAAILGVTLAVVAAALTKDDARSIADLLLDTDGPPAFPPAALVVATAVMSTASPHLSRPFRHLGRWLVVAQFIGAVFVAAALPSGATAAIAIGLMAAACVHLVVGSPGGRPTASRIVLALNELGVSISELAPATMQAEGVMLFDGEDADGSIVVKVYGRDAWDAQLLASLWRLIWYRGASATASLRRVDLVEHEGFVTLMAERAGVRVPHIVTAGSAGRGDALVVVRPLGTPIAGRFDASDEANLTIGAIESIWRELSRLHDSGLVHGGIDLDRVLTASDGELVFGDLSSASVRGDENDLHKDHAQVFVLSVLALGEERATEVARSFLGDETMTAMLPYVQDAAVRPLVRAALSDRDIDLDDVRSRVGATLGVDEQRLIKLRRVTWGSVLNLALLGIAAFTLIGLLGNIDLESFADALRDASWSWLAFALVLAQIPRIPAAVSTMGAIQQPLPLGPLTTLQFAITYVNLAIPSTAARVAINIRFFQRFGIPAVVATTAGVIDSVSGFVVQIGLFLSLFFWSDLDFGIDVSTSDLEGVATIALIVVVAVVVLGAVVLAVPALRHRVMNALRQSRDALAVLRSPTKLLQLFVGNLLSQVLFAIALGACVQAFGYSLSLSTLVIINTVVTLFAGLLPIPGGMGVSEAGLTIGLSAAGIPEETALAIAIAYRFASFYLPPIWGWFCYRWLVRRRYL
jgi:uncharacterized protein (TIRG00374 family)